jgi:hypothetical protein
MPDLRDALDRESRSFDLAPGALERMLDRQRRRSQRRRVGAAVLGLVITGVAIWAAVSLSGLERRPSPATHAPLPIEGTWQSGKLSESDIVGRFVAAGGTLKEGRAFFAQLGGGAKRYAVITLRFEGGSFIEFESGDGDTPVAGFEAHYSVSRDGVLTISSPRCTGRYSFGVDGGRLRLSVIRQCARHDGVYNTTLFASFPFTRQA